jgi:hypothetical protein
MHYRCRGANIKRYRGKRRLSSTRHRACLDQERPAPQFLTLQHKKKIAIVQSNFIPWKGYFDLIAAVDEFILFDDVQYTRRDWRNRNKIKTRDGVRWLTIPVASKGNYLQNISDVRTEGLGWKEEHLLRLKHAYAKARHFSDYFPWLERLYETCTTDLLSEVNAQFIRSICLTLGITTPIRPSSDFEIVNGKNERLIHLCSQAGASSYLTGPAARDYLDVSLFEKAGITIDFMSYEGYREYDQPHPPFEHAVSIVDLLLCTGPDARSYLKQAIS